MYQFARFSVLYYQCLYEFGDLDQSGDEDTIKDLSFGEISA
jgi:hypothetical protein